MLYEGDCLEIMPTLPDKSIDMILCDLPYGTTACKWDTIIPFEPLWKQYKRLIKDNGAIVLTASQPFTSALVMSNPGWFKYEWIWEKDKGANFASCKKTPMKTHENVLVFGGGQYFPQMKERPIENIRQNKPRINKSSQTGTVWLCEKSKGSLPIKYPESVLKVNACREYLHPTQKPVALFEYLIRTYTNEGDTVLDNCAGSGTTGIACLNTGRKYILIEKDAAYCEIIRRRIDNVQPLLMAVG
jgi:site-specific DNA-methyltransferase (adenine-specific)